MKLPKLKYYYLALNPDQYREFEQSRRVEITPTVIDVVSGTVSGRPQVYLASTASLADDLVREHYRYHGVTWVLRIPRDAVDRGRLVPVTREVYSYDRTLELPHCGVYRFELDLSQEPHTRVVAL